MSAELRVPPAEDNERLLYADALVGLRGTDGTAKIAAIRRGLPFADLDVLVRAGRITTGEIERIVIPRRRLATRRRDGRLTADESDRLARTVRIVALAEETFGSVEKAALWLRRATKPLDGDTPMARLDTDAGTRQVELLLGRIDHGLAA